MTNGDAEPDTLRVLLDTHVLIWAVSDPGRLSVDARAILTAGSNLTFFSTVSVWEIAIKCALGRPDFSVRPEAVATAALQAGLLELSVTLGAATRVADLPLYHRDPFDRLLVAQAMWEDARLLTANTVLAAYGPTVLTFARSRSSNV